MLHVIDIHLKPSKPAMESIQACHTIMTKDYQLPAAKDLETILDKKSDFEMLEIIRTIFLMQCSGQDVSPYVIPIIKNASTTTFKPLKRVLHQFWSQLDCYEPNGQLKPYVLLFCNSLRQDLGYANEYVVCSALRCIAGFGVREVVQHVVSGIPGLLEHSSAEVRATAAITLRALHEQFPGITSTEELKKRLLVEKDTTALQQMIISVANIDEKFFQQNIQSICDNFNYLEDQYEIGMGLITIYEKLPSHFAEQLIEKLRIQPQLPSSLLQSAGQKLLSIDPALGAQLLVIGAKNAPSHIQSHTIRVLGRLWDNLSGSSSTRLFANVARPLVQVFTGNQNQTSRSVQLQLFQSHIFQRLCTVDESACYSVLESLTSSPALESNDMELAALVIGAICEIGQQRSNSRAINPAAIKRLTRFVIGHKINLYEQSEQNQTTKNSQVKDQYHHEAAQNILTLFLNVFRTWIPEARSGAQTAVEHTEAILLAILEILLNTCTEQIFKFAAFAYIDILEAVFGETLEANRQNNFNVKLKILADTFLLLLPLPQDVEIIRDESTAQYFQERIAPLLEHADYQNNDLNQQTNKFGDNSVGNSQEGDADTWNQNQDNIPTYLRLKNGAYSNLTLILIQLGRRFAYLFDHQDFVVQRLLIGFAHLVKKTEMSAGERETTLTCLKDIYIYAESGEKTLKQQKYQLSAQIDDVIDDDSAQQSSKFSFFSGTNKQSDKQNKSIKSYLGKQQQRSDKNNKISPSEIVSERPELISNVYQLSADADLIYAEALVLQERTQIVLVVLFVNRTADVVESLQLELFTSGSLRRYHQPKEIKLSPHESLVQTYELSIAQCTAAVVYGNILARFSAPKARSRYRDVVMRIKEIQFDIRHFIHKNDINIQQFSRLWTSAACDVQCSLSRRITREQIQRELQAINLQPLVTQEINIQGETDEESLKIFELLFAGATVTGDPVLLAISQGHSPICKVRGSSQDVCMGLCQYLSEV